MPSVFLSISYESRRRPHTSSFSTEPPEVRITFRYVSSDGATVRSSRLGVEDHHEFVMTQDVLTSCGLNGHGLSVAGGLVSAAARCRRKPSHDNAAGASPTADTRRTAQAYPQPPQAPKRPHPAQAAGTVHSRDLGVVGWDGSGTRRRKANHNSKIGAETHARLETPRTPPQNAKRPKDRVTSECRPRERRRLSSGAKIAAAGLADAICGPRTHRGLRREPAERQRGH